MASAPARASPAPTATGRPGGQAEAGSTGGVQCAGRAFRQPNFRQQCRIEIPEGAERGIDRHRPGRRRHSPPRSRDRSPPRRSARGRDSPSPKGCGGFRRAGHANGSDTSGRDSARRWACPCGDRGRRGAPHPAAPPPRHRRGRRSRRSPGPAALRRRGRPGSEAGPPNRCRRCRRCQSPPSCRPMAATAAPAASSQWRVSCSAWPGASAMVGNAASPLATAAPLSSMTTALTAEVPRSMPRRRGASVMSGRIHQRRSGRGPQPLARMARAVSLAAARVWSISASVWAKETKRFSKAPGWNSTPRSSIPSHHKRKRSWRAWRAASR